MNSANSGINILVIDDDPAMTDLLKMILEQDKAQVVTANRGSDGVAFFKSAKFHMVIVDLMMPEMDGCEVTRALRQVSNVPILMVSALDNPGLIARALNAGADDFLIKPFTHSILAARINMLTRRRVTRPLYSHAVL